MRKRWWFVCVVGGILLGSFLGWEVYDANRINNTRHESAQQEIQVLKNEVARLQSQQPRQEQLALTLKNEVARLQSQQFRQERPNLYPSSIMSNHIVQLEFNRDGSDSDNDTIGIDDLPSLPRHPSTNDTHRTAP